MGTDMDGAIESRSADGRWQMEFDLLDFRPPRDYVAWDCLFGVRGTGDVERPLFPGRGLPDDVSEPVREHAHGDHQHSHTHLTWAEVCAVDWDEPLASRPAWYWTHCSDPEGEHLVRVTPTLREAAGKVYGGGLHLAPPEWPPGAEVHLNGAVYRPVVLTARMLAPPDEGCWAEVWSAMRDLAAERGDEHVRLIVWFG
ncbi:MULTISPECIES: hypothetical protein [Streptomyces]|uniref:Uncharacterized protein n=1 Tax=Streptomyces spinosisporus TaxID=2927582 RepID=A0ABS9XVM1_9ACTN|nr:MULTISPECIES: hypothetical protein [Streptomyces]MCI3245647.1 hypothetical protein [Streptomyces spinosisporus]WUB34444.1 hypothetical protein OHN38_05795 [Streptomyces sp. NBC_00588]